MGGEPEFGPITGNVNVRCHACTSWKFRDDLTLFFFAVYAFTVIVCVLGAFYHTAQLYRGLKGIQGANVPPCES